MRPAETPAPKWKASPSGGIPEAWQHVPGFHGLSYNPKRGNASLDGAAGVESMIEVAQVIGIRVHQSETKAGTLLILERGRE